MDLVLLDRDGVLNVDREDSVKSPGELVMLPGAAKAVARLNAARSLVVVVTNQSVVGRGIIDEAMLARIHEKLTNELATAGGPPGRPTHTPLARDPPAPAAPGTTPPGASCAGNRPFSAPPPKTP